MDGILRSIREERERQKVVYGNNFDDKNTINDWVAYITKYLGQCTGLLHNEPCSKKKFEDAMKKIAAIAVAGIEASQRNGGLPPRHYDK